MTQADKELLLKDLCTRLPYKVKVQDTYYKSLEPNQIWLIDLHAQKVRLFADEGYQSIEYIKPYLFPLSSMTEEQKEEFNTQSLKLQLQVIDEEIMYEKATEFEVDFYNKHHLDWRGLIPMGLAIDATNLNIY